jgi:hypothetical protein
VSVRVKIIMKTSFFSVLFTFATMFFASAQPFEVGTNMANVGLAIGGDLDGVNEGAVGLSASYDRGMWNIAGPGVISIGGYLGTTGGRYNSGRSGYYSEKWRYLIAGVRGAYHYNGFTKIPKLDVYGGAMVSYNILSYSYADIDGRRNRGASGLYGSGLGASAFVGGRWFFRETLAGFVEFGYGVSSVSLGATFKL